MKKLNDSSLVMGNTLSKDISNPPGGILIWMIIILEIITFGMGLGAMIFSGKENPEMFHNTSMALNKTIGFINTIVLLSSGLTIAEGLKRYNNHQRKKASYYINATILLGFIFVLLKLLEYSHKIELGIQLNTNIFYTFYWLLTGFHLVHILFGLLLLLFFEIKILKNKNIDCEDLKATVTFWHMCDLIWLMVFPVVYLIF